MHYARLGLFFLPYMTRKLFIMSFWEFGCVPEIAETKLGRDWLALSEKPQPIQKERPPIEEVHDSEEGSPTETA